MGFKPLILASSSPTRAQILRTHDIPFTQHTSPFDEEALPLCAPKAFVYAACMGKMEAYVRAHGLLTPVLCADTVVTANGELLRKAKDSVDARKILQTQSNNTVTILTATAYRTSTLSFFDLSATHYRFGTFDPEALDAYIASNEWEGKAGACMVEGFCKPYILDVRGYESCAMGLTVEKLIPWLA